MFSWFSWKGVEFLENKLNLVKYWCFSILGEKCTFPAPGWKHKYFLWFNRCFGDPESVKPIFLFSRFSNFFIFVKFGEFCTFCVLCKKGLQFRQPTGGQREFRGPRRAPYGFRSAAAASLLFQNTGSVLGSLGEPLRPPPSLQQHPGDGIAPGMPKCCV